MIKNLKKMLCIGALAHLVLITAPASAQSWGGRGDSAKLVVLNKIEFMHEQKNVEAVGTAEAVKSVTLYPAVADEVTAVNFVPGQNRFSRFLHFQNSDFLKSHFG